MNVNAFLQKDYENEPLSGPKKTNPIQTQFLQKAKIACRKIRPHPQSRRQKEYLALRDLNVYPCMQKVMGADYEEDGLPAVGN
jgi:hypothetical protein